MRVTHIDANRVNCGGGAEDGLLYIDFNVRFSLYATTGSPYQGPDTQCELAGAIRSKEVCGLKDKLPRTAQSLYMMSIQWPTQPY